MGSVPVGGIEYLSDLIEDSLPFRRVTALDGAQNAGVQVPIQNLGADLVERTLDGLDLADNVDAIFILLQHPLNPTDVPLYRFEP